MALIREMANAVRFLSVDAVQKANSGHPGTPLGMADVATVLWTKFLKFDAAGPKWADRDRFVLSAGHASAMLYSLLYLTGFADISITDIQNFRQLNAKTAGHPEYGFLSGIEATTGPLGQGISMAVGMALAEKMANARYGADLVNHTTYVMAGDGDLMEGISEEAISLAGHLKLNKLIVLWDNNSITIDGSTHLSTSTNQRMRFEANGWETFEVDGHDPEAIEKVISQAQTCDKPAFIACKTTIGYGAPTKAGTACAHGAPLGEDEIKGLRQTLAWPYPPFEVPQDILNAWREAGRRGEKAREAWENRLNASSQKEEFTALVLNQALPSDFEAHYQAYKEKLITEKPVVATRKSSQMALEALSTVLPNLVGGSADLTPSNLTKTTNSKTITAGDYSGNYIEYGIREHAMGALMNGIALHGGFIPYGGTFFVFVDYLKPALRLSAMMGQRVIYVLTHDSIGVGEDGPTHQPIEQLAMLRALPNLVTLRPADALETAESWQIAIERKKGPTALILTRQNVPFLRTSAQLNLTQKGAYLLSPAKGTRMATLIATGSEVGLAVEAQTALQARGVDVAVVSMPSWELFEEQPDDYRQDVLGSAPRFIVEAGSPFGWDKFKGENGTILGLHTFGASGPAKQVFEKMGLTVERIVEEVLRKVKACSTQTN